MQQQLINYAEEIIDIFRELHKEFKTQIIKEAYDYGFTVPQIMLMHELYHKPGVTLNELSRKLYLSKSTVSGIVDRLEKSGYIIKEIPETNRRIVKISLSSKGLENANIVKNFKTNHLAELLGTLELGDIEEIVYSLKKLKKLTENKNKTIED